jgi:hypothetical protein
MSEYVLMSRFCKTLVKDLLQVLHSSAVGTQALRRLKANDRGHTWALSAALTATRLTPAATNNPQFGQ